MLSYMVRRAITFVLTGLLIYTLAFFALRVLPGDPVETQLIQSGATPAQVEARRTQLGLDRPIVLQWLAALAGVLRGDFGRSLSSGREVSEIISEQLPSTAALAVSSLIVGVAIGIGCGLLVTAGATPALRNFGQLMTNIALSSPVFLTGAIAISIFSVSLRILPASGGSGLPHLILPALVLGFAISGSIARVTAGSTRNAIAADFTRSARSKGLREQQILTGHVLRASLPPIFTVIALQFGFLLGGTAITEALFVRPGVGRLLINAIGEKDYPVVLGLIVLSALVYSAASLAADLISAAVDPRLRLGSA